MGFRYSKTTNSDKVNLSNVAVILVYPLLSVYKFTSYTHILPIPITVGVIH